MATDAQKLDLLTKLSPTLLRYYSILLEHKTETPAGLMLVRMPAKTLKVRVREIKALYQARDALDQLVKHGVIKGDHPWHALELNLESKAAVQPAQKETVPKKPFEPPLPSLVERRIHANVSWPTAAKPGETTMPVMVRKTAVRAAQENAPVQAPTEPLTKKRAKTEPGPARRTVERIQREQPIADEKKISSMLVSEVVREILDKITRVDRIRIGKIPALDVFGMIAKAGRISPDDLVELIEQYERKK